MPLDCSKSVHADPLGQRSGCIKWCRLERLVPDQNENAYATVTKTFWTAGRYTITFEIEFYTSDGAQAYSRQKQYDITVVPVPTAVYQDSHNNQIFYWVGSDGVFDKPALAAEGYDPDNSNTPRHQLRSGIRCHRARAEPGLRRFHHRVGGWRCQCHR